MLHRPADAYAIWVFWEGEPRRFARWYLNLEAPIRRTSIGFDPLDHLLDLWSVDGITWHLKDEQMLDTRVAEGYFTEVEGAAIRAEADRFRAEVREHGPWWDEAWADWRPDPRWPVPDLPLDWERSEDPTSLTPEERRPAGNGGPRSGEEGNHPAHD